MSRRYDAIRIGTGQAGPPLAGRLDQAGMRTAIALEAPPVVKTSITAGG